MPQKYALFCQKAFKILKAIVWVILEFLSATEILSALTAKRLAEEQRRFLKRE